ncbi:hypothetical protein F4778DRAFT_408230 [Xylariomycetidae sp. FL2044]|nr:hypothetical protein F4778DRAFT_408230 [Xylariomycetidae sp. FL2044]
MELEFTTLDVFTDKRLEGNPLAVVRVPASLRPRLGQATKQRIAKEFNLSETVFLHEGDHDDDASASTPKARTIDIFTTDREVVFAGHPTIGTAVLCRNHLPHLGTVDTLLTKAGPIALSSYTSSSSSSSSSTTNAVVAASAGRRQGIRARIPHDTRLHARTLAQAQALALEDRPEEEEEEVERPGLSPVPEIRAAELSAPVFSVVNGMTFVLVRLATLDLLARCEARALDFDEAGLTGKLLDEEWRDSLVCRYYYVDTGVVVRGDDCGEDEEDEDGKGKETRTRTRTFRTRMLELGAEDPATGSAASALAAYLSVVGEGRRSVIGVETTVDAEGRLQDVWLAGEAVVVMKGTLSVDV